MTNVFLNFHPHLGDLALMRAVSKELYAKHNETSFALTHLPDTDLADFYKTDHFQVIQQNNGLTPFITKPIYNEFVRLDKRLTHRGTAFFYSYTVKPTYLKELEQVIDRHRHLFQQATKVYTLHYQFEVAYIGYYLAKKYGLTNVGFQLDPFNGAFILQQPIWHIYGIMYQLNEMLDINMTTHHLAFSTSGKSEAGTVLLLPASRGTGLLTNQHWRLAEEFFTLKGYTVTKAEHGKDYDTFAELAQLITQHAIIMCNDSFPYHMACGLQKPIILLEKAGFNAEWRHAPFVGNRVFSIPSSPMYEEEYLSYLTQGLQQLEVFGT